MSSFPNVFSSFKKVVGSYSTGDFDAWEAKSSYGQKEVVGSPQWKGGWVTPIVWRAAPAGDPPMADYFRELAARMWTKAKVDTSAARSNVVMGGHRNLPPAPTGPLPTAPFAGSKLPPPPLPLVRPKLPPPPPSRPLPVPPGAAYQPIGSPVSMQKPIDASIAEARAKGVTPPDLGYLNGVANDWTLMTRLERISAYTFRGDTRNPDQIKAAGGFFPPSTRTDDAFLKKKVYEFFKTYMMRRWQIDIGTRMTPDEFQAMVKATTKGGDNEDLWYQYTIWRAVAKTEELHLGRMLAEETLKGYVSTSRAVGVAKGFAGSAGWVYVVRVSGGIVVPEKGDGHPWTKIFGEQEIAYPGALKWDAVMGFRKITNYKFTPNEPLYLRKALQNEDRKAFEACYDLLSGKPQ
ncbi:MAG TPA: hypothetical protein VGT24_01355 [Candidatus Acidoferrales bacterium]|nr:hypothetical protein [Candidatus Acidoferrales bacterium]